MLFLLKILAREQLLWKCLEIRFRKSLPILEDVHLLLVGLNRIMFQILCLDFSFGVRILVLAYNHCDLMLRRICICVC